MRKLAAILLGGILLFNWVGYRFLNGIMQDHANTRLASQLNRRQYDESQLISIKVPVTHLSYYNNSISFERVDGQIEVNGIPYQYVKSRIYNDSIELLCIPNQTALKWRVAGNDYFKLINDLQRSRQGQPSGSHSGVVKSFVADPCTLNDPGIGTEERFFSILPLAYPVDSALHSIPRATAERPPIHLS